MNAAMTAMGLLAFWTPSGFELVVILVIALLLFGKRLPEVARGLGKGIVEFKKGVKGVEDEIDNAQYEPPRSTAPAAPPASTTSEPPPASESEPTGSP